MEETLVIFRLSMGEKTKYLTNAIVLSLLAAGIIVHNLFGRLGWYDLVWWLDDVMHALGGAWVAFFFLVFFIKRDIYANFNPAWKNFIATLGFVALIGVLWEFYEYLKDVYIFNKHPLDFSPDPHLLPDTLFDLFLDLTGAAIAAIFTIGFMKKNSQKIRQENNLGITP